MIFYVTQANVAKNGEFVAQFFTVQAEAVAMARHLQQTNGYREIRVVKVDPQGKAQLVELLNVASGHLEMHADAEVVYRAKSKNDEPDEILEVLS